jgi:hypothetical protein
MADSMVAIALRPSVLSEGGAMMTMPELRAISSTSSCRQGGRQVRRQGRGSWQGNGRGAMPGRLDRRLPPTHLSS